MSKTTKDMRLVLVFFLAIFSPWIPALYLIKSDNIHQNLAYSDLVGLIVGVSTVLSVAMTILLKKTIGSVERFKKISIFNFIVSVLFFLEFVVMTYARIHESSKFVSEVELPFLILAIAFAHLCYGVDLAILCV